VPRRPRFCPPGIPVHVIQRGNNRQACFTSEEDIAAYANWLREGASLWDIRIHGWVFMANHIHLLMTPMQDGAISKLMQFLGRQYVRRFNYRYARSGTLFDGRFKSSLVQDERYLLICLNYIELNPVRAGMVTGPGRYKWSSFRSHGFGRPVTMWSPHPVYLNLGLTPKERQTAYRELVRTSIPTEVIAKIRHCANTGLVLGTEKFREEIELLRT